MLALLKSKVLEGLSLFTTSKFIIFRIDLMSSFFAVEIFIHSA